MELTQLKQFLVIAKHESISKAAEELFVSQPALSQMLQKLEEELEVKLFDRRGNKITLNDNGKYVFTQGAKIINDINSMTLTLKENNENNTPIRVCSSSPAAVNYLLSHFQNEDNDQIIETLINEQADLENMLLVGKADIAVSFEAAKNEALYSMPFCEARHFAMVHKDSPLASKKEIALNDLKNCTTVQLKGISYLSEITQKVLSQKDLNIKIIYTEDYLQYRQLILGRKDMVVFMTSIAINFLEPFPDRIIIPLKEANQMRRNYYLVYPPRKARQLAPFLSWIREDYKNILV